MLKGNRKKQGGLDIVILLGCSVLTTKKKKKIFWTLLDVTAGLYVAFPYIMTSL